MTKQPPPDQPWQAPSTYGRTSATGGGQGPAAPGGGRAVVSVRLVLMLLLLAASIWFIAVNTQDAQITLWVPTYSVPVWIVLLATFVAGVIVGWLLNWRRRSNREAARR